MTRLLCFLFTLFIVFSCPINVHAEQTAGDSAKLREISIGLSAVNKKDSIQIFKTRKAMKNVLKKYNSPLVGQIDSFMNTCLEFELDCFLLPSIAGLESTFGQFLLPESYNPFGWGGGYITFDDWSEGIYTVGKGLRKSYINKGAETLEDIGRIYSESTTWSPRVQYFINAFRAEEEKIELFLSMNQVE